MVYPRSTLPKPLQGYGNNNKIQRSGTVVVIVVPICLMILVVLLLATRSCMNGNNVPIIPTKAVVPPPQHLLQHETQVTSITSLRYSNHHHHDKKDHDDTVVNYDQSSCRWYLAESAIPNSGLGLFTSRGLHRDDTVGIPDICIFVSDPPDHWTHLRSHSFGQGTFFNQYEGQKQKPSRAACEGFTTLYNTVPDAMVNTMMISPVLATNAGLHRATSPGAGSITHHYGIHGKALDIIPAGSELTLNYGVWDFTKVESNDPYSMKPSRPVEWLQQYGWCIDYIEIKISTIPHAGRGAFARVPLQKGQIIAPAPLQIFTNRSIFQTSYPEQLFINYCIQPYESDMLLYPYGVGVNLINHHHTNPNAYWRWSNHSNMQHHQSWLDLSYDEFWQVVQPGGLLLEVVALRDIGMGEEIVMDYGTQWDEAWQKHVQTWVPPPTDNAKQYVYPAEMDETVPLRTFREQKEDPYPDNLALMCSTPDWERKKSRHITWYESNKYQWQEIMTYCQIIDRQIHNESRTVVYTVSLLFTWYDVNKIMNTMDDYYEKTPMKEQYIDYQVPRRAIRFIEKPYQDDEHLVNAFRFPLELPEELTPLSWRK